MASSIPAGGADFIFIPIVPQKGQDAKINFRALINSLNDSFSPQWGEHMDMGRADPKFMYNQFSRTITMDFKIISVNHGEHKRHMQAMNSLASLTYPIYKPNQGFNGIYVKFLLGEYIKGIGLISSLSFAVDNDSPWIDGLPLYINCSMDIRYIGDKKPDYRKPQNSGPFGDGKYGPGFK